MAIAVSLVFPAAACAQSLFETLFGPSKPGPNRLLPPTGINPGLSDKSPLHSSDRDERAPPRTEQRGSYHTVCVRMCDGFYWPISYSSSKSRLYRDANVCSASCGSEAKLFHYRDNGSIQDAVDLSGLAYTRLPNAFRYRKTMVEGCACRPAPWSEAEVDRHRVYALNADIGAGKGAPAAQVAATPVPPPSGTEESLTSSAATDFTPAPSVTPEAGKDERVESAAAAVVPARKQSRSGRHELDGDRTPARRSVAHKTAPPVTRKMTANGGDGGFLGFGAQTSSKLVWPGDAPRRVR